MAAASLTVAEVPGRWEGQETAQLAGACVASAWVPLAGSTRLMPPLSTSLFIRYTMHRLAGRTRAAVARRCGSFLWVPAGPRVLLAGSSGGVASNMQHVVGIRVCSQTPNRRALCTQRCRKPAAAVCAAASCGCSCSAGLETRAGTACSWCTKVLCGTREQGTAYKGVGCWLRDVGG